MQTYIVSTKGRLDAFLAGAMDVSRVRAGVCVRNGAVKVNGRVTAKPAHIVEPDDTVEASLEGLPVSESHIEGKDLKLAVLYEDDACVVFAKPEGVAVHPAPGIPKDEATILHGVAFFFAKHSIPFVASHILVHRLDRETTGCLLVAKTPDAHRKLQEQFATRTVEKTYLAIVAGVPEQKAAIIDAPIGRSTQNRTKMAIRQISSARAAKTTYRVLSHTDNAALVACTLHTGRTHQLRVHLSSIGHPILGDPTYHTDQSVAVAEELGITELCLHAWQLSFDSPVTKERVAVHMDAPRTFVLSLKKAQLPEPKI